MTSGSMLAGANCGEAARVAPTGQVFIQRRQQKQARRQQHHRHAKHTKHKAAAARWRRCDSERLLEGDARAAKAPPSSRRQDAVAAATTAEARRRADGVNLLPHDDDHHKQQRQQHKQSQLRPPPVASRALAALSLLAIVALLLLATSWTAQQVRATSATPTLVIRVAAAGGRRARNSTAATPTYVIVPRRERRSPGEQRAGRSARLAEVDALNYLQRYGYMNSTATAVSGGGSELGGGGAANLISEDSFQEAVMQFQRFAGIPETGAVDALTQRFMALPRCGNRDLSGRGENGRKRRRRRRRKRKRRRRRKRYALQGSKWRRQELTYRISQYPTRFQHKKHEVDGQIEKAFRIWSRVAPIDFVVKKEGRVHIDIRFASGEHGDGDPFDGPGNTLAHAYFPQYGGDAHFDDQEYWTVDSYAGTNIFQVAAHELGHSLGLGHSSVREALMAPFYQKYKPNFKLHADDVLGIQALYGDRAESGGGGGGADSDGAASDEGDEAPAARPTPTSTTEATPPARRRPTPPPSDDEPPPGRQPIDLCQEPRMDAITRTEDGNTYVFRGQFYWQIKNEGLANNGQPGKISRDWEGLPGDLDAALTWSDGKTFFFKGDKYWRFTNKRRAPGYPKLISAGFAGIPNNVDAAFVWSGNGKTYFFKRDKYWRFDSKQEPPVSGQYPKPVKNWAGLPAGGSLDAAFKWENGMTYFFKDDQYWRFDDRQFEVDTSAKPAFPRAISEWWFGCPNSNLPLVKRGQDGAPLDNETSASSSSSLLSFHRKPELSYEAPAPAPGRSFLSSLSAALFPSSSASSSGGSSQAAAASARSADAADWSFHRGLGEEVRRLLAARSVQSRRGAAAAAAGSEASRWSFPLASGAPSGRGGEQSLSELRARPADEDESAAEAEGQLRGRQQQAANSTTPAAGR